MLRIQPGRPSAPTRLDHTVPQTASSPPGRIAEAGAPSPADSGKAQGAGSPLPSTVGAGLAPALKSHIRRNAPGRLQVSRAVLAPVLWLLIVGSILSINVVGVHAQRAQAQCFSNGQASMAAEDDAASAMVFRNSAGWGYMDPYNHLRNFLARNQHICIPGMKPVKGNGEQAVPLQSEALVAIGTSNLFPYGQCTWWANQRYFQLHGVYVPWATNADAWQWTTRAYEYHWHVSNTPAIGAIIDLQPWVEGAYGLGHVAVVERILNNGDIITSNMNWGGYPGRITYVEFAPGPGVTFIIQ